MQPLSKQQVMQSLLAALVDPSPDSWHAICTEGNRVLRENDAMASALFYSALQRLEDWPKEFDRKVPEKWPPRWKERAEYRIKEIHTYGYFAAGICGDPRLQLSKACYPLCQAVRLKRRFVGAAKSIGGDHMIKVGEQGEADLTGGMTVEFPAKLSIGAIPRCIEVTVEVEIKGPDGKMSPEQATRQKAIRKRGGISICITTVEDGVVQLLAERARIVKELQ